MATDYGTDISTFAGVGGLVDIDPRFPLISGPRVPLEHVARRLMTMSGTLPGGQDGGFDLTTMAGKRMSAVTIKRAEARIAAEAARDQRVRSAEARIEQVSQDRFRVRVSVRLVDGPFSLVLSVSSVTVELLEIDRG